jgi:hypothetical protein
VEEKSEESKQPFPFHQTITMVEYERLIRKYIRREIDTEEFAGAIRYAACMLEKFPINDQPVHVLEALWDAEDNLVVNPSLGIPSPEDDVTEDQLREIAEETYFSIKDLYFAGKLYEPKSAILKQLSIKIIKVFFSLILFLFFLYHGVENFTETVHLLYYTGDILSALNSFILFLAFAVLSFFFGKSIYPKSFEVVEIKRLFFALILPKPRIEAFEDA